MSHAGKPGSRRLVTLLACCVLVAAWLQTVPLSAGADTPPWVQQSSPEFIPAAISCVSGSDFCMAVGINEDGPGADTTAPVAESWNGSSWTVTTMPSLNVQTYLTGVSCTSLAQCVAVGYTSETSGGSYLVPQLPTEPLAENWDGTSWSIVSAPLPTGSLPVENAGGIVQQVPTGAALTSVSCLADNDCTAVGDEYAYSDATQVPTWGTLVETWNGTAWTVGASPEPSASNMALDSYLGVYGYALSGVSCPAADQCVAVGSGPTGALALLFDGSIWTLDPSVVGSGQLNGVSCTATNDCMAVGVETTATPGCTVPVGSGSDLVACGGSSLAESWNGATWQQAPTPTPSGYGAAPVLIAVTCSTDSSCVAVGQYHYYPDGDVLQPFQDAANATMVQYWDGSSWSLSESPSPGSGWELSQGAEPPPECLPFAPNCEIPAATVGGAQSELLGVSCLTAGGCIGVGFATSGTGGNSEPLVEAGPGLSPASTVPLDRYADVDASSVHWATTNASEVPTGFAEEETLGYVFADLASGLIALYSCKDGGDGNYLSVDQTGECETGSQPGLDATSLGIDGYIYASQPTDGTDAVELYRCLRSSPFDYLETTIPPVSVNGQQRCGEDPTDYAFEGSLGWILATQPTAATPEAPYGLALPVFALGLIGGMVTYRRQRAA